MEVQDLDRLMRSFDGVETSEAFGYRFYFVGSDHRLPFATIAESDNDYDSISNLDRPGVFRLNVGIGRESYEDLCGELEKVPKDDRDYTALNVFQPHPDYAAQRFFCILNPTGDNEAVVRKLLAEAYEIARTRTQRTRGTGEPPAPRV